MCCYKNILIQLIVVDYLKYNELRSLITTYMLHALAQFLVLESRFIVFLDLSKILKHLHCRSDLQHTIFYCVKHKLTEMKFHEKVQQKALCEPILYLYQKRK